MVSGPFGRKGLVVKGLSHIQLIVRQIRYHGCVLCASSSYYACPFPSNTGCFWSDTDGDVRYHFKHPSPLFDVYHILVDAQNEHGKSSTYRAFRTGDIGMAYSTENILNEAYRLELLTRNSRCFVFYDDDTIRYGRLTCAQKLTRWAA